MLNDVSLIRLSSSLFILQVRKTIYPTLFILVSQNMKVALVNQIMLALKLHFVHFFFKAININNKESPVLINDGTQMVVRLNLWLN